MKSYIAYYSPIYCYIALQATAVYCAVVSCMVLHSFELECYVLHGMPGSIDVYPVMLRYTLMLYDTAFVFHGIVFCSLA